MPPLGVPMIEEEVEEAKAAEELLNQRQRQIDNRRVDMELATRRIWFTWRECNTDMYDMLYQMSIPLPFYLSWLDQADISQCYLQW